MATERASFASEGSGELSGRCHAGGSPQEDPRVLPLAPPGRTGAGAAGSAGGGSALPAWVRGGLVPCRCWVWPRLSPFLIVNSDSFSRFKKKIKCKTAELPQKL